MSATALYRIKPLQWREGTDSEGLPWAMATTVFNNLNVTGDDSGSFWWRYCVDEYYDKGSESCDSIEAGKAAAEKWYMDRLSPALEAA